MLLRARSGRAAISSGLICFFLFEVCAHVFDDAARDR
jgi:hypothetical protein